MDQKIILYYNPTGKNITVGKYNKLLEEKNKKEIANFIYNRLYSRYIKPFEFDDKAYKTEYKNGFSMMANACLLIETLQSFREGLGDSGRQSGQLFTNFFVHHNNFKIFKDKSFYKDVRCGILHQGETTGGWKINRKKKTPLLDDTNINANKFIKELEKSLRAYRVCLKKEEWDSETWDNLRTKMRTIIKNAEG